MNMNENMDISILMHNFDLKKQDFWTDDFAMCFIDKYLYEPVNKNKKQINQAHHSSQ